MAENQNKFLDYAGLNTLWTKISDKFVRKEFKTGSNEAYKVLSDNNYTDEEKEKLAGIQAGAQVNNIDGVAVSINDGEATVLTTESSDGKTYAILHLENDLSKDLTDKNPLQSVTAKAVKSYIDSKTGEVSVSVGQQGSYVEIDVEGGRVLKVDDSALVGTVEKANSALQSSDITEGATNGTISVKGSSVAVHGLGTAAYTDSTAYDVAGAAADVATTLKGRLGDASTAETIAGAKAFATESANNAASAAETNAKNYADTLASNYATAEQGTKADSALQSVESGSYVTVSDKSNNKQTINVNAVTDISSVVSNGSLADANAVKTYVDSKVGDVVVTEGTDGTYVKLSVTDNRTVNIDDSLLNDPISKANSALQEVTSGNNYITISDKSKIVANVSTDISTATTAGVLADANAVKTYVDEVKSLVIESTQFIGVTTTAISDGSTTSTISIDGSNVTPSKADIAIYGSKEFIWTGSKWVELGDTTAEANRLTDLENWKTTTDGKITDITGDITEINGSITGLGGRIDALVSGDGNVTSFGGQTGGITVNTGDSVVTNGTSSANGSATVKFAMSSKNLTGNVALPKDIWTAVQGIDVTDTTTIDMTVGGSGTTKTISASAKTGAVAADAATLTTGKNVYDYVTGVIGGLDGTVSASTNAITNVVTSISQTDGKITATTTAFVALTDAEIADICV